MTTSVTAKFAEPLPSLRLPVAVGAALVILVATAAVGIGWRAVVLAAWALPVVLAAIEDAYTARLRDAIVLRGVIGVGAAIAIVTAVEADSAIAVGSFATAAGLAGWLFIFHLISPTGMGFGDVKFAGLLGLGIGTLTPVVAVMVAIVAVASQVVVVMVRPLPAQRRGVVGPREAPFGPALAVASIAVVGVMVQGGGW